MVLVVLWYKVFLGLDLWVERDVMNCYLWVFIVMLYSWVNRCEIVD